MESALLNKLPKKYHPFIKDIYKEEKRYSVVLTWSDGFSRSIGDTNFSDLKDYIRTIIEEDRTTEI